MTLVSAFGTNGNGATGPASSAAFGGAFTAGLTFKVTTSGQQLNGYYVWRADSSQSASVSCGLWVLTANNAGTFQTGTSASSSSLVVGQWNYIPLAVPFALTSGTTYRAVYGLTGNFPDTGTQFGTGGPYAAGIVNGPLTVFSAPVAQGGSNQAPFTNTFQGVFGTAGSDPTVNLPSSDDHMSNFWIDMQIGPASATVDGAATLGAAGALSSAAALGSSASLPAAGLVTGLVTWPAAAQLGGQGAVTGAAAGQGSAAVLGGAGSLGGPSAVLLAGALLAAAGTIGGAGGGGVTRQGAAMLAAAGFLAAVSGPGAVLGYASAGDPAGTGPAARAGTSPQPSARAGTWP